jgi:TP901 family phage tail tape measure protein
MAEGSQDIILNVGGDTRQLERDIQRVVSNSNLNLNTKGFSQPLGKITGQLGEFEKSLAASNARVIAFGVSAGAIYAVEKAFSEMIKSTLSVEKSLAEINTILSVSQKELNSFGNNLFELAKNTGQSFDIVAKSALEFSRQGLGVAETLKRTNDALILTRLSGMDVVSSTESITAALNSFNQTAISSNELINKLVAVDNGFSVSSADLAEAIKRVGSSAQDAGVGLDELIALVTSAQQITSRGGSVIGNSFKTIFTRLQRPEVLSALDELGVKTKDAEGNIMPLIQILSQLSSKFESLTGTQRSQIAELVGGVFQINILKASLGDLSKQYSIYSQALETSSGATDEANKRNEALNQTLAATLNKTLANLSKSASEIGNLSLGPAIQKTLGGLNSALENFSTKGDGTDSLGSKIGQGIARGLGNFLGGPGIALAVVGLAKVFERLTNYSKDAFKSLSGLNNASMEQSQIQSQVLNIIGKNPKLIDQINKGTIDTAALHREILSLIEQETANMQKQISIAATLAKSLSLSGVGLAQSGPLKGTVISNKIKAYGHIPNFSYEQTEILGAAIGGYKAGNIKRMNIAGEGSVIYNDAESVVKFPGASQPAIIPPKNSSAGQNYGKQFEKQIGFDPYNFQGFVPNFASEQRASSNKIVSIANALYSGKMDKIPDWVTNKEDISKINKTFNELKTNQKTNSTSIKVGSLSEFPLLALTRAGSKQGYTFRPKNGPVIDVLFPVFQFDQNSAGFKLDDIKGNLDAAIDKSIKDFAEAIYKTRDVDPPANLPGTIEEAKKQSEGLKGSIEGSIGGIFESAFRASFGQAVKASKGGTFDIQDLGQAEDLYKFFSPTNLKKIKGPADFKNSDSSENRESMGEKIIKTVRPDLMEFLSKKRAANTQLALAAFNGFIPNFSALEEAVQREKKSSPNSAPEILWSDTLGSLVVANSKQTAKYGKNADRIIQNDHINQGQLASRNNLMMTGSGKEKYFNRGFIPNFASTSSDDQGSIILNNQTNANKVSSELEKFISKLISLNKNTDQIDLALKEVAEKFKITKNYTDSINVSLSKAEESIPPILPKNVGLTQKIKDNVSKAFNDEALPQNIQNFKSKLIFASFGLSMIGGFASNFAGDNKKAAQTIDSFTQSVGTASTAIGLIPGPAGIAIGSLIGIAGVMNALTSYLFSKAPDIEKSLEKIKDENSNFANGTQKYSTVLQKLTEAYSNPKTKSSDLVKLNKELLDAAREIPSAYRLQLLAIQDNTKLQEEITKIQKDLIQKQKGLEFAAKTQSAIDSNVPDNFLRFFTEAAKGIFGGADNIIQKMGGNLTSISTTGNIIGRAAEFAGIENKITPLIGNILENIFQDARSTLLKTNLAGQTAAAGVVGSFSKEGLNKFEELFRNPKEINSLRNSSGADFINKMQRDFGLDKNVSEVLRNASPEDIKRLREQIIRLGSDSSKTAEVMKKTEAARQELNKQITEEKKNIDLAKSSVERFKEALVALAQSAIEFRSYREKFNQQSVSNKNLLDIEKAKGLVDYQKPFLNSFEEAKLTSSIEELMRRQDFVNEAQTIKNNTNENLMKTAMASLGGMKGKVEDDKYNEVLTNLSKINTTNSGENVAREISSSLDKLGKDFTKGDREKLNTDLRSNLDKQNQQLIDLNQKNAQANAIANAQLQVQKAMASRDVDRAAFGGQSAFGFQDLRGDRQSLLDRIKQDKMAQAAFNAERGGFNSSLSGGQTPGFQTGLYKMIADQLGGFAPGEERGASRIREAMISSRTNDILYQGSTLRQAIYESNRIYDSKGQYGGQLMLSSGQSAMLDLLNSRMSRAKQIAATQVDEALKTGKATSELPLNVQGMANDVKTITGLLQQISGNMNNTISSGIRQAIKDSISNYLLGLNPSNAVDIGNNNIKGAQTNADFVENIGNKKIDIFNALSSKVINEANLKEEMSRTTDLRQNMLNANESLGKWIETQVKNAVAQNKPIMSLEELTEQEKKKNSSKSSALQNLTKDTGSVQYQAFEQYIENAQKIQELQQQIKGSLDLLQQKQQEIQQEISKNLGKEGAPSLNQENKNLTSSGNMINRTVMPNGQVIIGYTGAQPKAQSNSGTNNDFERLASIIQRVIQAPTPQLQNNSSQQDIKSLNKDISNLSSAIKTSFNRNTQPENVNVDGNINVSPLAVEGSVAVNLTAPTFKIEIADSDLEKTKQEIEKNFDQKLKEMSQSILAQVQKGVAESLRQSIGRATGKELPATTDNPFRNYGVGRSFIG